MQDIRKRVSFSDLAKDLDLSPLHYCAHHFDTIFGGKEDLEIEEKDGVKTFKIKSISQIDNLEAKPGDIVDFSYITERLSGKK